MMFVNKFVTLNNGRQMPALGIGTWRAPDQEVEEALEHALVAGYRHIDTSPVYRNEPAIGRVLRRWLDSGRVKREDLFIVTKLPPSGLRASEVREWLTGSLNSLQLSYVDVYLIHTPFCLYSTPAGDFKTNENGDVVLDMKSNLVDVWKKMEQMVTMGLTKSIGVSNFNMSQIERVIQSSTIRPVNLQIEMHIYLQQTELLQYCKENNIVVTAFSPLGSMGISELHKMVGIERNFPDLMQNPTVVAIALRLRKTPAQVLIKWILQQGVVAIPKSTNGERLRENMDVYDFVLTAGDNAELRRLNAGIRICDMAFLKGCEKHPEFPW